MTHFVNFKLILFSLLVWLAMLALCIPAWSAEIVTPTDPPVYLTIEEPIIIDLKRDVGTVVIPNSDTVNIIQDSSKRIVLMPHNPGSVFFSILDTNRNPIMQRYAIVSNKGTPQKQYVRIHRNCDGVRGCEDTSYFFCDGLCSQMSISPSLGATRHSGANPASVASNNTAPQSITDLGPDAQAAFDQSSQQQSQQTQEQIQEQMRNETYIPQ